MSDGKVARIDTINAAARNKIVDELNGRVDLIKAGRDGNQLTIREGISDQAVREGVNRALPENYKVLL